MTLHKLLGRLIRDQGGNTLAIFAAALVPLTAMVGIGMDLGLTYMARAKLQNACDAGVLAGRQTMMGTVWNDAAEAEADKFFEFNFPEGTHGAVDLEHSFDQNQGDRAEVLGSASAVIPTSLMYLFGYTSLPIAVECNAKRDLGHNDIMLVLDVTGSMAQAPSNGGGTRIGRLRTGTMGLYRALEDDGNSTTRYGIMPYSWTVNVARSLSETDILDGQQFIHYTISNNRYNYTTKNVGIANSSWGSRSAFRISGEGCIEERPTVGNAASPVRINDSISRSDIDSRAADFNQNALQFGRYDPTAHTNVRSYTSNGTPYVQVGGFNMQHGCPSEARKLQEYDDETAFQTAINLSTARVTGGTYHDVGMLWGMRFLSRTGFFSADNPTEIDDIPVNQHIVFMTDGMLDTGTTGYSAHSVEARMGRTQGSGTQSQRHIARFNSICSRAKAMGVTIWVIAFDVIDTSLIEPCATSSAHFYTSDGSDLEEVFERIGQGIAHLRLTR